MNNKHLAAIIIFLFIAGLIQGTLWMQGHLNSRLKEEESARTAANGIANQVMQERKLLTSLKTSTKEMIAFLIAWEPYFISLNTPNAAELAISTRIKDAKLLTLSQRYENVAVKGDPTIPRAMRANLIIEADYIQTLNWLGRMETEIPTLRIANLRLTKGQGGNDIKAELVLELPLATP